MTNGIIHSRLRTITGPASMSTMDPELSALISALARLDADVARARLELVVSGGWEDV